MSVTVSAFHTVEVASAGAYLAAVDEHGLHIWPAGAGQGPSIRMTRDDWRRISREVALAFSRADGIQK